MALALPVSAEQSGIGYVYGNIALRDLRQRTFACGCLIHEQTDQAVKMRAIRPDPTPRPHPHRARLLLYAPIKKRDMSQLF